MNHDKKGSCLNLTPKKQNKMEPFLRKKVFYKSLVSFILENNKAIDNTAQILILSNLITNIINKIKYYVGWQGNK